MATENKSDSPQGESSRDESSKEFSKDEDTSSVSMKDESPKDEDTSSVSMKDESPRDEDTSSVTMKDESPKDEDTSSVSMKDESPKDESSKQVSKDEDASSVTVEDESPKDESSKEFSKDEDTSSIAEEKIIEDEASKVPERGKWDKSIESLLCCISMSVGLGNIWRFPNIAYNNGGGAFLIPYLILLFIIGRPLYYLELILGQFSGQGPVKMWRMVPALKGVGYAQVISISYMMIFYNYLMAISVFYFFASMSSCLPWTECHYAKGTFSENGTTKDGFPASEYFWKLEVVQELTSDKLSISWKLALCLIFTWILVYGSVIRGTRSLGKMSYFTSTFPFVGLAALLIVACLQDGAYDGVIYFYEPEVEKLKDVTVWYRAVEQSFFSLSVGYGNIIMLASYNKFTHNVYRDAIIISLLDTVVSLLAGTVSFAVLGSLAHKHSKNVRDVVKHEGMGLVFVVYPEALAAIPYVPQLWSVILFFMIFVLGIGSSMSIMESILTVLKDRFPVLRRRNWLLSLIVCGIFCALGLPLTTNVGQLILVLLNNYGTGMAAFFYAIVEVIGVAWIYGIKTFSDDVTFMLNRPPGIAWKFLWAVTTPISLVVIFIFGIIVTETQSDSKDPLWTTAVGWFLAAIAFVQIPCWFIVTVYKDPHKTIKEKLLNSFKPAHHWGPRDPDVFENWKATRKSGQVKSAPDNIESPVPS